MRPKRIPLLAELFPSANFVVVLRDIIPSALSLLRGRQDQLGSFDSWLSIRPRGFTARAGESPEREVVRQMTGIREDLAEDCALIGPERCILVHYEHFLQRPQETMTRLQEVLAARGLTLERTGTLPATLSRRKPRTNLTEARSAKIREIAEEVSARTHVRFTDVPSACCETCLETGKEQVRS